MNKDTIIRTYKRHAGYYDNLFGSILNPGRKLISQKMNNQASERVLEIGVGTGISLSSYPPHYSVAGIDLSPHMLLRAAHRVLAAGLTNITLYRMNAENIGFADGSFDKVVAMYVASVVPNPRTMISEMKRVCKAGGDIFILNHFSKANHFTSALERLLSPLAGVLGFRPLFPMEELISGNSLDIVDIIPVNALGYWTLIHARNVSRG